MIPRKRFCAGSLVAYLLLVALLAASCRPSQEVSPIESADEPESAGSERLGQSVPTTGDRERYNNEEHLASPITDTEISTFLQLRSAYFVATTQEEKLALLDEIGASCDMVEIAEFLGEIAAGSNEELALLAVDLLSSGDSSEVLAGLSRALDSPLQPVRCEVATALGATADANSVPLFDRIFQDPDPAVQMAALTAVDSQPPLRRTKIIERAFGGAAPEVQKLAIGLLELEASPQGVDSLIAALDSTDPEVSAEAQFSLGFLLDQDFPSPESARTWWLNNRSRYGRGDLFLRD